MTTQAKKVKPDNLMGATEVAEYLEVSRQRVLELRQKKEGFPRPVAELKSGPVWDRAAIDEFVGHWERKPGRPRKDPLAPTTTASSKEEEQYDPATSPGNEPEQVAEPNQESLPGLEQPSEPAPTEDPQEPVQQPQEPTQPQEPARVDNPQVPQQPSADQIDLSEEMRQESLHSDNG